jgi:adenylate cyclase
VDQSEFPHLLLETAKGKHPLPLVGRGYWTVGRSKDNDLVIPDRCMSRNHAILQATAAGEYNLIDLGSRNGTFVNGRRVIIPVLLKNGDRLAFGKTEAEFYCPETEMPTDFSFPSTLGEGETSFLRERRLISVVVADMRNFTKLAKLLDDQILSALIGNWFRQAGNIVRQAESWVDKYIGDAIMAIWFHGRTEVSNERLLQIFRSVIDLNQMTQTLNSQYSLPFPLRIGVGINTGYAMVGNTGSGDHPDYTAIGDTVNAAFRFESATKEIPADVAIGETSYNSLAGVESLQQLFEQHTVTLKGYGTSTNVYGITFESLAKFFGRESLPTEAEEV